MRNTFKRITASIMAVVSLSMGVTGVAANAAETDNYETSTITEDSILSSSKSFSFTNYGTDGAYVGGTITLTSAKTITISFGHCSVGSALVSIRNSSTDDEYGSFVIPSTAGTTLYTYFSLPKGSYSFYVTPYGCNSTSGSFTVTY